MQSRALRWGLAVVGAVVLAACGGGGGGGNGGSGGGPAPSPTVSGVTIEPGVVDLARGSSTEFRLRASYSDGSDGVIDDSVSWQSADTSVAAVNQVTAGIATLVGYNPGTTLINARWSGHSAALQLRVGAAEIVGLELQSPSGSMAVGAEAGLRLFARYTDGTRAEHTALANWTSDDPTVVEVRENAAGGQLARALQVGQARVAARLGALEATADITVEALDLLAVQISDPAPLAAVGSRLDLRLRGSFGDDSTQDLTTLASWSVADPAVLRRDADGLFTALAAGVTSVRAELDGRTAEALVTISDAVLVAIEVDPPSVEFARGSRARLEARGVYSDGSIRSLASLLNWESSAPGRLRVVASAGDSTIIEALDAGEAIVWARVGGIAGSARMSVSEELLVAVSLQLDDAEVLAGTATGYRLIGTFSDGSEQDLTPFVAVSSDNPGVALVDLNDPRHPSIRAVQSGDFTLVLQAFGITLSETVTVQAATLLDLSLDLGSEPLIVGGTRQFRVTGEFSDGSNRDLTGEVRWETDPPGRLAIATRQDQQPGLARALAAGTSTVTVHYHGRSAADALDTVAAPNTPGSLALVVLPNAVVVGENAAIHVQLRPISAGGSIPDGTRVLVELFGSDGLTLLAQGQVQTLNGEVTVSIQVNNAAIDNLPDDVVDLILVRASQPETGLAASAWMLVVKQLVSVLSASIEGELEPVGGIFRQGDSLEVSVANPTNRALNLDRAELLIDGQAIDAERADGGAFPGQSVIDAEWSLSADYPGASAAVLFSFTDLATNAALELLIPLVE